MRSVPKLIFGAPVLASAGISTSRIPRLQTGATCGTIEGLRPIGPLRSTEAGTKDSIPRHMRR
ncbi:MAG: hypothetical protein USCAAHI_00071 [Beijerinckiaceae bacterium]|nr:MAG: hypothetical protein USCAAHI_00071 [Beijerinckiaceae bacterium]